MIYWIGDAEITNFILSILLYNLKSLEKIIKMHDEKETQNNVSSIVTCEEKKRGKALVININIFSTNLRERMDSKRDIENLMKSLQKQGFGIEFAENLTKSQIESSIPPMFDMGIIHCIFRRFYWTRAFFFLLNFFYWIIFSIIR